MKAGPTAPTARGGTGKGASERGGAPSSEPGLVSGLAC